MPRFRISSGASNDHTQHAYLTNVANPDSWTNGPEAYGGAASTVNSRVSGAWWNNTQDVLALVQKRYNITGANEEGRILVCHIQASGALTYPAGV